MRPRPSADAPVRRRVRPLDLRPAMRSNYAEFLQGAKNVLVYTS